MIATTEFCNWIKTTSFAGLINPGEQWDTAEAWPTTESMTAARECFIAFEDGHKNEAEKLMHRAQAGLV